MSTDSTELTFIRCPSCRSLVPAVSPRCRMCGAVLDAGKADASSAAADKDANKKIPARVRQQTIQVSDREVSEAKNAFGGADRPGNSEPYGNREVAAAVKESKASYQPDNFAPNYDSDTEVEELLQSAIDSPAASTSVASASAASSITSKKITKKIESSIQDESEYTDFGDPLGAFIEEVPVEESIIESSKIENTEKANGNGFHEDPFAATAADTDMSEFMEPQAKAEPDFAPEPPPQAKKQTEAAVPLASNEPRSRVVIESGQRRAGPQKGLSFGRGRSESPVAARARSEEREASAPAVPTKQIMGDAVKTRSNVVSPPVEVEKDIELESSREIPPSSIPVQSARPSVSAPKPGSDTNKGRLLGWLVSYSDPKGVANELRDGKFFVSRSSLKGSDLILDDESISTPHALFAVNHADGLRVQDLMSDRGVFIRRRTGEAYQRVLESTKLEHGDWIRFGDVEFLVAIIAAPTA